MGNGQSTQPPPDPNADWAHDWSRQRWLTQEADKANNGCVQPWWMWKCNMQHPFDQAARDACFCSGCGCVLEKHDNNDDVKRCLGKSDCWNNCRNAYKDLGHALHANFDKDDTAFDSAFYFADIADSKCNSLSGYSVTDAGKEYEWVQRVTDLITKDAEIGSERRKCIGRGVTHTHPPNALNADFYNEKDLTSWLTGTVIPKCKECTENFDDTVSKPCEHLSPSPGDVPSMSLRPPANLTREQQQAWWDAWDKKREAADNYVNNDPQPTRSQYVEQEIDMALEHLYIDLAYAEKLLLASLPVALASYYLKKWALLPAFIGLGATQRVIWNDLVGKVFNRFVVLDGVYQTCIIIAAQGPVGGAALWYAGVPSYGAGYAIGSGVVAAVIAGGYYIAEKFLHDTAIGQLILGSNRLFTWVAKSVLGQK